MAAPLLECRGLGVRFGGLQALSGLELDIRAGEILGIIGPNGAGKSTLFNLVTGIYRPSAGTIRLRGEPLTRLPTHEIVARGVARTFQNSRLMGDLSLLDNIIVGMHSRTRSSVLDALFRRRRAERELRAAAERALSLMRAFSPHLAEAPYRYAAELPQADRRRLEILRALASEPALLLLDEPSAGMNEEETRGLMADIERLRAERPALAVMLIEHDMAVVGGICERVVVLDYGVKIAEGRFEEVRRNRQVQEAYLGKSAGA